MKDKFLALISIIFIILIGAGFMLSRISEENDMKMYSLALADYKNQEYKTAYRKFGKISVFSDIKAPALFRRARCATLLGDVSGAKRNYSILLFFHPNSQLFVLSEYNLATLLYENNDKSAKRYFSHIIKYFPDTDYALAAEYYIGCMDMDSAQKAKFYPRRKNLKHKSLKHFIRYVKLAPNGRFIEQSADKISKLGIVLDTKDNIAIATSCYKRGLYDEASKYFMKSPINMVWAEYAQNEYKKGNYSTAKIITENGIKYFSSNEKKQEMYEDIDSYIALSDNKLQTINYLCDKYPKSGCVDYLLYLKAKNSDDVQKYKLYQQIYENYPDSLYAPEALYETFYRAITKKDYDNALKLGHKHISRYKKSDTAPAVLFWMGKVYERKNSPISAGHYYKKTISEYPDSYYSYRAYLRLNKNKNYQVSKLSQKCIEFPYKNKNERDIASKLIALGDYDFVLELYKDEKFVESWVEYKKGNYSYSAILAEKAMKNVYPKPKFSDLRWRLVYPLNYWDYVYKYRGEQEPFIILSIIREESHYNPDIVSSVGAVGLMQLMPDTAKEIAFGKKLKSDLFNPEINIRLGSIYYSQMKTSLGNEDLYAVMAYNGGRSNVVKWLKDFSFEDIDDFVEKIPFIETQSYVKKVLRSYWCYLNVYK